MTDEGTWEVFSKNYTHNCNRMAALVIHNEMGKHHQSWWQILNGMSALDGRAFLGWLISRMQGDYYEQCKAMNPPNGWGALDSFLAHLRRLSDVSLVYPDGVWRCTG